MQTSWVKVIKQLPKLLRVVFVAVSISAAQNTFIQLLDFALRYGNVLKHLTSRVYVANDFYSTESLLIEVVCVWPVQVFAAVAAASASSYVGRPIPMTWQVILAPISFLLACVLWLPFTSAFLRGYFGDVYTSSLVLVSSTLAGSLRFLFYRKNASMYAWPTLRGGEVSDQSDG